MIRSSLGKATFVALAALFAASVPACSGTSDQPKGVEAASNSGIIAMALQVAPGLVVNTVAYTVTGNGQNRTGNINTTDPNSTPSLQIGLPAGTGYSVSLTAQAVNGVHCAGSQTFSVVAGATSSIFVNLQCDAQNNASNIGGTIVNGVFVPGNAASCPDVAFYTVAPLQTTAGVAGLPIAMEGGGTTGTTTNAWSVVPGGTGTGHITNGNTPTDAFHCDTGGDVTVRFTVTDGKSCVDSADVVVHCVSPGTCGNSIVEAGEACDDGNTVSGDGCSATCGHEVICGDSVVEGAEQCDPPLANFCSATCQHVAPVCGNGVVQAPEVCDDGNTLNNDTCNSTCTATTTAPVCGNGIVEGAEACDDGNTLNGDLCNSTCTAVTLPPPCGNGHLDPGEQCDPPNTKFCNATCQLAGTCTTCENANCGTVVSDCVTGANPQLCLNALECARTHNDPNVVPPAAPKLCYQLDPANCYCGTSNISDCQLAVDPAAPTHGPHGPCITEYNAAASGTSAAVVLGDLTDPATALGRAGFIQQCDDNVCASSCF